MTPTPLQPFGVALDVDATRLSPADVEVLRDLLAEHGVVVLRDQDLDDAAFVAFLRRLGELAFTVGEVPVPGRPELNVVTNVGRDDTPVSRWHVDTSYVARPPAYTALRIVDVPERGGETLFSDQVRALDTLDDDLRATIEGRTITHVVTGLDLDDDAEARAEHPIARPHPRTGRPSLYLSTRDRCSAVSGLSEAAGRGLVDRLLAHSTRDDNVLAHTWAAGDVVVWDNARVLHRADHDDVVGDRTFHRGMVAVPPS